VVSKLTDVNKSVLARHEFHECTEGHDSDNLALEAVSHNKVTSHPVNLLSGRIAGCAIGSTDDDGSVV
jgi:hypothetical protein